MSGQSFPQDVVAGTQLVIPSIHSPNYVTNVSGWTINLDGSAEFNNLTIRGTFSGNDFIVNSSGAFFYSPSEGLGNLIVSIASSAGTDSFGNTYPQGINVTTGAISGTTISGSTISGGTISGTTITGTTFDGTDFILNTAGAFFYSGTPALGNLIASISSGTGTDSFGNTFFNGFCAYNSTTYLAQMVNGALFVGTPTQISGGFAPGVSLEAIGTGNIAMFSGGNSNADIQSFIEMLSQTASGITNGFMTVQAGQIQFGPSGNMVWNDSAGGAGNLNLAATTGPFITGETFHTLSNPSGVSGACRVKLVPWNMVAFDMRCTVTLTGATQTLVFGNLPNSNYWPTTNGVQAPASIGGTPSTDVNPRVQINTSGGVQAVIPAGSGTSVQMGAQFYYPIN